MAALCMRIQLKKMSEISLNSFLLRKFCRPIKNSDGRARLWYRILGQNLCSPKLPKYGRSTLLGWICVHPAHEANEIA